MDNNELNLNELEEISGGKIHFEPEKDKPGWIQHKVTAADTLIRIANKFGMSSYKKILKWNPKIHNPRLIRTGDYLYIKK